jgi:hypothetical protein
LGLVCGAPECEGDHHRDGARQHLPPPPLQGVCVTGLEAVCSWSQQEPQQNMLKADLATPTGSATV